MREFFDAIALGDHLRTLSEKQSSAKPAFCPCLAVTEEGIMYMGKRTPPGTPVCRASIGSLAEADMNCGFVVNLTQAADNNPIINAVCKRGVIELGLEVVSTARVATVGAV